MSGVAGVVIAEAPSQPSSAGQGEGAAPREASGPPASPWPVALAIAAIALFAMTVGYQMGVDAMRAHLMEQLGMDDSDGSVFFLRSSPEVTFLDRGEQLQLAGIFAMRSVVTLSIMGSALYVILTRRSGRYPTSDRKWAYAALAAIMAFWLAAGSL